MSQQPSENSIPAESDAQGFSAGVSRHSPQGRPMWEVHPSPVGGADRPEVQVPAEQLDVTTAHTQAVPSRQAEDTTQVPVVPQAGGQWDPWTGQPLAASPEPAPAPPFVPEAAQAPVPPHAVAPHPVAPHPAVPAAAPAPVPEVLPTARDFLQGRHQNLEIGPATWGWRGWVRRLTFGLVKPRMGAKERAHREARAAVQRSFSGPRTIVFANPKGGAAKTTSVLAAGYTFGTVRGGGVVAWDNNETRGTLGIRGEQANHQNTTRELLDDLERFSDVYESRIGDLGAFVRSQGDAHFDVLASDERADVTGTIKADDFQAVHRLLERFYHLILVDTGNNLRAENWLAAAATADLIVVTCTVREDTGYSGLWMLDALADAGHADLFNRTVTVLADPSPSVDSQLADDLVDVYGKRTRAVFRIPYDPALVAGSVLRYDQLSEETRSAWLQACAEMARAL